MKKRRSHAAKCLACIAVIVSAAVLFGGCSYFEDKFFPTTVYEETQTTAPATSESETETKLTTTTEATTSATTEETTTTEEETETTENKRELTLKDFKKIDKSYSIKDVVNEVGPYTRFECSDFYVWTLKDSTEIWVFRDTFTGNVRDILNVNGIEETLIYTAQDESIYMEQSFYAVNCTCGVKREFGPELEKGWYSLEKDDGVYIIYSSGKQGSRGTYAYCQGIRAETVPPDTLKITFTEEKYVGTEELEDTGESPCPCCTVKLNRIPLHLIIRDTDGNDIPFKGSITEADLFPG